MPCELEEEGKRVLPLVTRPGREGSCWCGRCQRLAVGMGCDVKSWSRRWSARAASERPNVVLNRRCGRVESEVESPRVKESKILEVK